MPNRLGLALLGLTVGGATFLFTGVAVFLSIASLQERTYAALERTTRTRGPRSRSCTMPAMGFRRRFSSASQADDCCLTGMQKNKTRMLFRIAVMAWGVAVRPTGR